ncbi:MAG: hypothetical protein AAFP20_10310 [Cyanobacteria bacterium J06614_10]
MPYRAPHTVDIPAPKPINTMHPPTSPTSPTSSKTPRGAVVGQSISVDVVVLLLSALLGVILSGAVNAITTTSTVDISMVKPPLWFVFVACVLPSALWLFVDTLSALSNPMVLPFARSRRAMKALYAKRMHLLLLFLYFTSILVALCWSAFSMLLVSKIFVSAVFAIALFALGQSIPSRKLSFLVSGILFLVVLIATQAFIILRLESDSARASQEALDGLNAPEIIEEDNESFFEERGE